MVYRTIKYKGQSLKKLKSVVKEIEKNKENIIIFEIEVYQ